MNITKIPLLVSFVSLSFVFTHCKKDDEFVNLQSTISSDNNFLGAEEGNHITFNINLTDELSEDLPLEMQIVRDLESGHFINLDDFEDYYEYSSDLGENWKRVRPNQVMIPKRSKNLKIRMFFVDDNRLETDEEFTMIISPKTDDIFKISGEIAPVKVLVEDNESNLDPNARLGIEFHLNENNNYVLTSISKSQKINKVLKDYIDNGPEEMLINDLKTLVNIGGIPIKKLTLLYDASNRAAGYVINSGRVFGGEDHWEMGLNMVIAYEKLGVNDLHITKEGYNSEAMGHTLVHEYGHILTLNLKNEVDPNMIMPFECENLYLHEGCFNEESILNQFNEQFYLIDQTDLIQPTHVTEYAKMNIAEDIAETFTFFIGQQTISQDNDRSSGALKKINFVANNERLKDLKNLLVDELSFGQSEFLWGTAIHEFNRSHNGERISCLDHERIKELFKTNTKN